jgi:DNA invertase Pin-like site-specific DNA recombinase
MVITKSVTRFARNTVTTLESVRELKLLGVDVFFEKENIYSMSGDGELMLTILASYAQEESRSASENVKWRLRNKFKDGRPSSAVILGYKLVDGVFIVIPEEAEVVRMIFADFLAGMGKNAITKKLTALDVPTKRGGKWNESVIYRILRNEKYKGDLLLQKVYTVDFLSKKKKVNEGEVPQYYVEGNHDAIIEPGVFDAVQKQIAIRCPGKNRQSSVHIFSSKIKCGDCGGWYGAKVWHSNSKYRRTIWQCNHKFEGGDKCGTPHFEESEIEELFLKSLNILCTKKDEVISAFDLIKHTAFATADLEKEKRSLQEELNVAAELIHQCIQENAHVALDQGEYQTRYDALAERFDKTKERLEEIRNAIIEKQAKREKIEMFLSVLKKQDEMVAEFDENLWYSLVDYATVFNKEDVRFTFKDGTEIRVCNSTPCH